MGARLEQGFDFPRERRRFNTLLRIATVPRCPSSTLFRSVRYHRRASVHGFRAMVLTALNESSVKNVQAVDLESQSDRLWKSNLPESRRSKGDSLQI
jgi:hypothetical protein